jgi:hypothetical protein
MRLAPVAGSLAVNAALLVLLTGLAHHRPAPPPPEPVEITLVDVPRAPAPVAPVAAPAGGGAARHGHTAQPRAAPHGSASPWGEVAVHIDDGGTGGTGGGTGGGHGRGIGLGDGGVVERIESLPVPPAPPPPSRARVARLLHPTRETEVDDAELFVAMVTVDTDGDVVGARMLRTHPGSRGDTAASMIWQFRYAPALDDDGNPVRSTFEQKFAVR